MAWPHLARLLLFSLISASASFTETNDFTLTALFAFSFASYFAAFANENTASSISFFFSACNEIIFIPHNYLSLYFIKPADLIILYGR